MLSNLWEHVKPTMHQVVGYLLLSCVIIIASYYGELANSISTSNDETGFIGFLKSRIGGYIELLQRNGVFDIVVYFLIAIGIGALIYLGIWLVTNGLAQIIQKIEFSINYVHPKEFYEVNHWFHVGAKLLIQVLGLILFAAYSIFWAEAVLPATEERFRGLIDSSGIQAIGSALMALLLLMLSFHIFTLILRVVFMTYPGKNED